LELFSGYLFSYDVEQRQLLTIIQRLKKNAAVIDKVKKGASSYTFSSAR
jgi:hypothetical protein